MYVICMYLSINFEQKLKKDVMAKIVSKTKREIDTLVLFYLPCSEQKPRAHLASLRPADQAVEANYNKVFDFLHILNYYTLILH